MNLEDLIKEYNRQYAFIKNLKANIKRNKWLILYLILIVICSIAMLISFIYTKVLILSISIVSYIIVVFIGYKHQEMVRFKDSSVEKNRLEEFKRNLVDQGINTIKQLEYLDAYITKEINYLSNVPTSLNNTYVRPLIIALFTSGLLSYSFKLISEGNAEQAKPLLVVYLSLIGLLMVVISAYYSLKESFSRISKLKGVSSIISLIILEMSVNQMDEKI